MTVSGVSLGVERLRKSWGNVEVLRGVDFGIEAGGFLTLLGPSGCGKSTALRLITGLDEVNGGSILIDGRDVTKLPAAERNIGMVFQNYALFPHMSVADNIGYGLKVRRVKRPARRASVARVAELMALGNLLDRKPAQLSGGQQQRVALARVLVSERPLVLMDEPLSNLDAKLRTEIRSEIKSLNKSLGITVVYVTHDQSEALSMSDTVVLMNRGTAVQLGTPEELYNAPASTFAAGFIGTPPMNLLAAEDVDLPEWLGAHGCARPSDLLLGVRPEKLSYPGQGMDVTAAGRVIDLEYEGDVFLVHIAARSGATFIMAYHGVDPPREGDEVIVGWDRKSTHLFSRDSGEAVPLGQ